MIQSSTAPDPGYQREKNKNTINITNKSQVVSPFPASNEQETQDTKNTNDPQNKYCIGRVIKNILLEGLNRFYGANLTLSSNVDQDT